MRRPKWMSRKQYLLMSIDNARERLGSRVDMIWLCKVRNQHQEKMASYGTCIRCGKKLR